MNSLMPTTITLLSIEAISAQANSRNEVKRSGRSQNTSLQKGLRA